MLCKDNNKENNKDSNKDNSNVNKGITDIKRKRIRRIKILIIIIVILLLILPSLLCIVLGFQVNRLQRQVDSLATMHNLYDQSEDLTNEDQAYASVKSDTEKEDVSNKTAKDDSDIQVVELNNDNIQTAEDIDSDNSKGEEDTTSEKPGIYEGKKVYLTFDDGPSEYTGEILDILADYNIKATFFVIGKTDEDSKNLYKRIVNEGHTLGMHSYSHQYDKIYNSVEDFDKDFTKLWKLLYDTTGYKPSIYRFPGGSDNLVNKHGMESFIKYLNNASVVYFDWNVVNGDATRIEYSKKNLIDNVLNGVANKETAIVLMHDSQTKKTTADSLPELLKALVLGGAQVLPLDKDVMPIQMIEADTVK